MSDREAKNALFDAFAEVAKALASGRRAEIVDVLAQGERSVDDLAAEIGQSVANTSHHLQALVRAGLLTQSAGGNAGVLRARERSGSGSCGPRCVMSPRNTLPASRSSPRRISGIGATSNPSREPSSRRACGAAMSWSST